MTDINPNRIVSKGPIIDFDQRHDRVGVARRRHRFAKAPVAFAAYSQP